MDSRGYAGPTAPGAVQESPVGMLQAMFERVSASLMQANKEAELAGMAHEAAMRRRNELQEIAEALSEVRERIGRMQEDAPATKSAW